MYKYMIFGLFEWKKSNPVLYTNLMRFVVVVQSLNHSQLFANPWTTVLQTSLSFTISQILVKLISIELVMPSNHLILCHPLLLPLSILSSIRVFSNGLVLHIRWPKYWNFSFSISPPNEYSGLISLGIDWFDHHAVNGTLKSFPTPQLKSINSSVLSFLYSPTLTSIHDCWGPLMDRNLVVWSRAIRK